MASLRGRRACGRGDGSRHREGSPFPSQTTPRTLSTPSSPPTGSTQRMVLRPPDMPSHHRAARQRSRSREGPPFEAPLCPPRLAIVAPRPSPPRRGRHGPQVIRDAREGREGSLAAVLELAAVSSRRARPRGDQEEARWARKEGCAAGTSRRPSIRGRRRQSRPPVRRQRTVTVEREMAARDLAAMPLKLHLRPRTWTPRAAAPREREEGREQENRRQWEGGCAAGDGNSGA